MMIRVLQNRQASENFSTLQNLTADAADHVLQAQPVSERMIALRAGKFAQANGRHLEQSALDLAREIGVPLHAPDKKHSVGIVRVLIHERVDSFGRRT